MDEPQCFEVAQDESGHRLDVFLAERLGISRARTRRLLARGVVRVEGRLAQAKGIALRAGERVEVEAEGPGPVADPDLPLAVLAEGPGWLVADKPAGMPVHPYEPDEGGTLLGAALARNPEIRGVGEGGLRSGVVHRLDVDTSGALLLATQEASWQRLREAFRSHAVAKTYRAVVLGNPGADAGSLDLPLVVARHRPAFVRVARDGDSLAARLTHTRWRVLERLDGASLVEVETTTGFLHQVRASLAHVGHPLAGDATYAGGAEDPSGATRHLLHASRLAFEEIEATSPDPADFRDVLARLRR